MRPAALLCVVVVVLAGAGPALAGAATQQTGLDPDGTTVVIDIRPNGDARFSVVTGFDRSTENGSEAYARLAERFERGETEGYTVEQFRTVAADIASETGRSMEITEVGRATPTTNETGYLALNFTWTNFAVREAGGNRLVVQDAFNGTNGRWLTRLGDDQTLVIRPPEGYSVSTAPVAPQGGSLRWPPGSRVTIGQEPVVFQGTPTTTEPPDIPIASPLILAGGGLAVVVAVLAAYLILDRRDPDPGGMAADTDGGSPDPPPADAAAPGAGSDAGGSVDAEPESEPAPEPANGSIDPDPELLSDEERVERLLKRNGGRMKQTNIVDETGWSNAKVSQLLSSMAEDGQVEKLRIGRENLISLPEEGANEET